MTTTDVISLQTVIVPAIVALATLALPKLLDRWKDRRQLLADDRKFQSEDRQTLALSEQHFRVLILDELKACKAESLALQKENSSLQRRVYELEIRQSKS